MEGQTLRRGVRRIRAVEDVGDAPVLSLARLPQDNGRRGDILCDESIHCNFGIDLINTIKLENPNLWTPEFRRELTELFHKAVELEYAYAEDTMPRGVPGLNAPMFKEYLRFVANRRAQQIGLDQLFPGATNPFPWVWIASSNAWRSRYWRHSGAVMWR